MRRVREDLNNIGIVVLDYMYRFSGLEVEINDGRIIDHTYIWDRTEATR